MFIGLECNNVKPKQKCKILQPNNVGVLILWQSAKKKCLQQIVNDILLFWWPPPSFLANKECFLISVYLVCCTWLAVLLHATAVIVLNVVCCCTFLNIFFFLSLVFSYFSKFFIRVNKKNQLRLMFATTPFHMQANKNSFLSLKKTHNKYKNFANNIGNSCMFFVYLFIGLFEKKRL